MKQMVRYLLAAACLLAFNFVVASSQEQIDRSQRSPFELALLLPQPKHVSVIVLGENGLPVPDVSVEHANLKNELVTDANGKAEFNTSAPYFVLSKPGYESVRLATEDAEASRVALHQLAKGEQFPVCTNTELSLRAPGWNGIFQLPKIKGTKATVEKYDVDYAYRVVSPQSGRKRLWVEQGRGPMWGGLPEDSEVWKATRYRGASYKLGDLEISDAKVWLPNGKCVRSMGWFGESIVYYGLNCDATQPLDDLMDKACAIPDASKHLLP